MAVGFLRQHLQLAAGIELPENYLLYRVACDNVLFGQVRLAARIREQVCLMVDRLSDGVEGLNSSGELLMRAFERHVMRFLVGLGAEELVDNMDNRDRVEGFLAELWERVPGMHARFVAQWEYEDVDDIELD